MIYGVDIPAIDGNLLLIGFVPDESTKRNLHPPPLGHDSRSRRTNLWRADAFSVHMKEIPLTNSPLVALVDDEDFAPVSKYCWHVSQGYVVHSVTPLTKLRLHRVVMRPDKEQLVDHKNHNPLDCRKSNLRIATKADNNRNQILSSKRKAGASSEYKGVYWHKRDQKWRAQIGLNYKRIMLGNFSSELEAARAYNRAAKLFFGQFAFLNPV